MAAIRELGQGRSPLSRGQILALAGVLAGGILLGWYGFRTAFGEGTSVTVPIPTLTVRPATLQQTATTSGNVNSQHSSKLTFPIAGRLASIPVIQGQSVNPGDTIATLDTTQLQIALNQSQSQENAAQAKLDALLAGQTPDVVEAAKAAVTSAQSAETSAEGQLSSAQTAKQTAIDSAGTAANGVNTAQNQVATSGNSVTAAQDSVTTAENAVTTAQNAVTTAEDQVTTARSQVVNAQSQLTQAQNAFANLLQGPTPQDITVSETSVNAARVALNTAQASYNRLVNHTDIATRPETTALVQASSAFQVALANLANSVPAASNPIDIATQQFAVQAAQQQVTVAQGNAANAQQSVQNAILNLADAQTQSTVVSVTVPPVIQVSGSGISNLQITGGGFIPQPGPTPINPAIAQAQDALLSAQSQANSAASQLIAANQNYQQGLANLQKLLQPYSTQNIAGLQAQVDSARQQLDIARRNFDNYINLATLDIAPESAALQNAQSSYNTAVANYNLKVAPPRDTDLSNARAAVANAQAQVDNANAQVASAQAQVNSAQVQVNSAQAQADSAQAAERNAELAVNAAQTGVSNAQLAADSAAATAANADSAINTAASGVDTAKENINAAQQKLNVTVGPPLPTDVAQLVEAVNQAKLAVQNAQNDLANAVITTPFAGIITSVTANPGDQVTSGTQIALLVDPTHIEVDAQVDESTYGTIKLGMPVLIRMDALPNQVVNGVISDIVPSGVTQQGVVLFPVVITITSPGVVPPNGASASQISVILQAVQNVIAVPGRYIYRNALGQQVVDVVRLGKRYPTPVQTGLTTDTATEITSGLKPGDQIALPLKKGTTAGGAFGAGGVPGIGGTP